MYQQILRHKYMNEPKSIPKPIDAQRNILLGLHHRAIELRYLGYTYKQICETLAIEFPAGKRKTFHESTVRRWYMRGGILEAPYYDYCKKENERRRQLMVEDMKKLLPMIPPVLQQLLDRKVVIYNAATKSYTMSKDSKLDMVTVQTVKLILSTMGFQLDGGEAGTDPADKFFDRLDSEIPDEHTGQ